MRKFPIGMIVGGCTVVALWWLVPFLLFAIFYSGIEHRAEVFALYQPVLEHFHRTGTAVPDSFEEVIARCNASAEGKEASINSDFPRPVYRPAGHLRNGPYLVLIESPTARPARDRNINVIYAYPDGEVDTQKLVSRDELDLLIRDDDRRREVGARTSSQPSSQPRHH